VKVAVLSGGYPVRTYRELRLRFHPRLQEGDVGDVTGNYLYPLDMVFVGHRVLDARYLDQDPAIDGLDDRHMLLFASARGVLLEQLHGLPAADQFALAAPQHLHYVSADLALVNLELLRHSNLSSLHAPHGWVAGGNWHYAAFSSTATVSILD